MHGTASHEWLECPSYSPPPQYSLCYRHAPGASPLLPKRAHAIGTGWCYTDKSTIELLLSQLSKSAGWKGCHAGTATIDSAGTENPQPHHSRTRHAGGQHCPTVMLDLVQSQYGAHLGKGCLRLCTRISSQWQSALTGSRSCRGSLRLQGLAFSGLLHPQGAQHWQPFALFALCSACPHGAR